MAATLHGARVAISLHCLVKVDQSCKMSCAREFTMAEACGRPDPSNRRKAYAPVRGLSTRQKESRWRGFKEREVKMKHPAVLTA
ncbi:hypothetical protein ACP90_22260 [Labrenzia sp. CP4]|nr:hypothetical protein ACP90_22260 [Labrenzia sp. CP4]